MRNHYNRSRPRVRTDLVSGKNLAKRFSVLLKQKLDENTLQFLTDIHNYFNKKGGLTPNQYKAFEKAESRFSPEAQKLNAEWQAEYNEEKRENMRIAAEYYMYKNQYFKDLAEKVLMVKDFVPTRKQYQSMVENKFAQKVIKATKATPKFGDKDSKLVQLRKGTPGIPRGVEQESLCLIVKPNSSPVTSDARGAKKYLVLPFGHTDAFEVEERYIKKYRGSVEDAS